MPIEIQNFGQVPSKKAHLKIFYLNNGQEVEVASGELPKLKSFQKTTVKLTSNKVFTKGIAYDIKVIIYPAAQKTVTLQGTLTLMN